MLYYFFFKSADFIKQLPNDPAMKIFVQIHVKGGNTQFMSPNCASVLSACHTAPGGDQIWP